MEVIWADVPGYEGRYRVSTQGDVIGPKGKLLKHSISFDGYHEVGLYSKGSTNMLKVHRIVARTFLATWNSDLEVNHKDGTKITTVLII